ncbi:MAG: hypothetical protein AAGA54_09925 [Myxococcota bacterium]
MATPTPVADLHDDALDDFEELDDVEILEDEDDATLDDEERLPFDTVDLDELEAQARAHRDDRPTVERAPFMSPEGVGDPFPDRGPRTRPREVLIPGAVALGLAGAGVVMARLALLPDCNNREDVSTCAVPDEGDIGARGGRLFGAVGFGVGGAVFGVVAGREFSTWLAQRNDLSLQRKRRIAIGTGTTAVILGTAGMAVGASLFGVGARRSIEMGREFDTLSTSLSDEEMVQVDLALNEVRTARTGLMLLVAAPTFFTTGVSILRHRPRAPQLSLSPQLSTTYVGLTAKVQF